jgi:hypothetical protein
MTAHSALACGDDPVDDCRSWDRTIWFARSVPLGVIVSDKSPKKSNDKTVGKSLKEKRAAKKAKKADKPSDLPRS